MFIANQNKNIVTNGVFTLKKYEGIQNEYYVFCILLNDSIYAIYYDDIERDNAFNELLEMIKHYEGLYIFPEFVNDPEFLDE